ncbi:SHOCT domain-containing protein [Actinoplanes missouriensis]|uniref:SHOCT domain-containing protein n=1 Tax=Actinoplanes missouriensis TaxID=1866 RepID=UPI0034083B4D
MMYDYPYPAAMGFGGTVFVLLLLLGVAAFVALAVWPVRRHGDAHAERILANRFATGEIDAEEYERSLRLLRAVHHQPS